MTDQKKKPKTFPFEMTIPLRRSITLGKDAEAVEYSEIALREPTVSEISQFLKKNKTENAVDTVKFLISTISGVPLPVIEKVGATDFYKAQEYLLYFLNPPEEDDPEGNEEASQ